MSASAFAYQNLARLSNSSGVNNGDNVNKASSPATGAVSDSFGSQSRRLPAKAVVNIVNESPSTADEIMVNVSRNSTRSVVPTAAVLAAELLKRATPPSVVGVPKCRKKL